jgi:hypothetical protein
MRSSAFFSVSLGQAEYVELPGSSFLQAGAILNFPIKMLIASGTRP